MKKLKFINHKQVIKEAFENDPELKKVYDDMEFEFSIIRALIKARNEKKLSQREFSKRIKIAQSSLARFESGRGNPTLSFLQKITKGLNLTLTVKPTHG
ncbi:MAG: helix-turn-helix transcriptional regulator [Patescibacteria group bacterium]